MGNSKNHATPSARTVFHKVGQNLYRLESSGAYYALFKRGGKQIRPLTGILGPKALVRVEPAPSYKAEMVPVFGTGIDGTGVPLVSRDPFYYAVHRLWTTTPILGPAAG